jgi:D-alanyl-D-alanine carboxypeptidase
MELARVSELWAERWSQLRVWACVTICSAVLLSLLGGTARAAPPDAPSLQKALDRLVTAGVPGAVLLVRDGDRTIRLASGYSVVAGSVPARPRDRFRIGSVTKTFIATVVLQLVAEGKVGLDDTVEHVLPGKLRGGAGITVRQLLQQTSGLHDYLADPRIFRPYRNGNIDYAWTPPRLLAIANGHEPNFRPGARWEYSNTNYLVLGLIIEAVTGNPLASELERRIFGPAGLQRTSFDKKPTITGRHMHGYFPLNKRLTDLSALSPSAGWAAGAIVSTADDVARFYRALLRGRLVRPDLLREMESTVPMGYAANAYGLGLWRTGTMALSRTPFRCGAAWGHNGDWLGYNTNAFSSKDATRQFVLFVNRDEVAFTPEIARAIFAVGSTAYCGTS